MFMQVFKGIFLLILTITSVGTHAQPLILPLRQRAVVEDNMLRNRLDSLLPGLMRQEAIDMWVLVAREYNEDPVMKTMLPSTWLHARRRTILRFTDKGPK